MNPTQRKATDSGARPACWWSAMRCSTATGTARWTASRPEAPVPVVKVTREEERIGAAANVAYNVATLGAQASFLGVVGDDEPGRRLEALLRETGIATHLKRDPGLRTTVKLRVIGRHQQLLRMDFESEPDHEALASQTETFARLLPLHDAVLFSDYGKGGLAHITAMIEAARAARQGGAGRPEGIGLLPLRGRHGDHAQPQRAAAGGRRVARRRRTARQGAAAARPRCASTRCW